MTVPVARSRDPAVPGERIRRDAHMPVNLCKRDFEPADVLTLFPSLERFRTSDAAAPSWTVLEKMSAGSWACGVSQRPTCKASTRRLSEGQPPVKAPLDHPPLAVAPPVTPSSPDGTDDGEEDHELPEMWRLCAGWSNQGGVESSGRPPRFLPPAGILGPRAAQGLGSRVDASPATHDGMNQLLTIAA